MFPKNRRSESMSTAVAQELIRKVASPREPGESVKASIGKAARRLSWTWNRAKDVWYGDGRIKISADELAQLRTKAQTKEAVGNDIVARIERLEALMLSTDAEFYSEQISHLRSLAGRNRNANEG